MLRTVDRFKDALQRIESGIRINHHRIKRFTPNVRFSFEKGHYLVKTAENGDELNEALRLRFDVFFKELMNKTGRHGIDVDRMDFVCDHLLIIDKRINQVIGTYRLNCSLFSDEFYSSGEFDLSQLLVEPGVKLEAGRACIHKDYRNGVIITLLWRAIAEYVQLTGSKYLFGCASVHTIDTFEAALIYKHLQDKGHLVDSWSIAPTRKYRMPELDHCVRYIENSPARFNEESVSQMVPALLQSYFRVGAKVCGAPALDKAMHCIDFLTVLKIDEMNPLFQRKYKV